MGGSRARDFSQALGSDHDSTVDHEIFVVDTVVLEEIKLEQISFSLQRQAKTFRASL